MVEEGKQEVPQFGVLSFEAEKVDLPSAILQKLRQAAKETEREEGMVGRPAFSVPRLATREDFPARLQSGYRALVGLILKK